MLLFQITEELITKFIRFSIVGASGIIVDFGSTWLFKNGLKINKYIANGLGFTLAATSNYILNRIWTFHSHNPEYFNEYIRFYLVSLIGLGLNTLIIWLLNGRRKWNFWTAKLIATAMVMLWNFLANLWFTFNAG